jgi:hypothetical protein
MPAQNKLTIKKLVYIYRYILYKYIYILITTKQLTHITGF